MVLLNKVEYLVTSREREPLEKILDEGRYRYSYELDVRDEHESLLIDREIDSETVDKIKNAGYAIYKRL